MNQIKPPEVSAPGPPVSTGMPGLDDGSAGGPTGTPPDLGDGRPPPMEQDTADA